MYKIYFISGVILLFLLFDWQARMVFMARAYPGRYGHGKSWNRAHKHYKQNWSLFERILWLFVFREYYEGKYKAFAYLSYIHAFLAAITVCFFWVSIKIFPDSRVWVYEFIGYSVFTLSRFIYNDSIARGII